MAPMMNGLTTNCIEHGFPNARIGEVHVSLQPSPDGHQGDNRWCLGVSDTGGGLPADFEVRRKTSLGLQLVDDFSRQLGGGPTADSTLGKGTAFTVVFGAQESVRLTMSG